MSIKLIATTVIGSGGGPNIEFANIPQTGTDLLILASTRAAAGATVRNMNIRLNGSTSGYSERMMDSDGSGASAASTSAALINWSTENDSLSTANTFSNVSIYIPNYSGNAVKSLSMESSSENNATFAVNRITAAIWSGTSPITSVQLIPESGSSFVQNSSASIYMITKGSNGVTVS